MISPDSIRKMTSQMVAKIDMKYVDPNDFWEVMAAAHEAISENTQLIPPDTINLPTFLAGIIVGQAFYECSVVPQYNDGRHSDLIQVGRDNVLEEASQ